MSRRKDTREAIRTVEIIDAEVADLTEKRREINRRLTALRAEKRVAEEEAARARAEAVGARILAAAGDEDALMAIVAEVSAEPSEAAPPASGEDGEWHDHGHESPTP